MEEGYFVINKKKCDNCKGTRFVEDEFLCQICSARGYVQTQVPFGEILITKEFEDAVIRIIGMRTPTEIFR